MYLSHKWLEILDYMDNKLNKNENESERGGTDEDLKGQNRAQRSIWLLWPSLTKEEIDTVETPDHYWFVLFGKEIQ